MAASVFSVVLSKSILVLLTLNALVQIFAGQNSAAQAIPIFKPFSYKLVEVSTGKLLSVDEEGNVHAKGDDKSGDHVCFSYHKPTKDVVMLESTSGLGYVSVDSEGNVVLSKEQFSDEEEVGSGLSIAHRRFKAKYGTGKYSHHPQVQLEVEDLPGCTLAFDNEGEALNACKHDGTEAATLKLLHFNC